MLHILHLYRSAPNKAVLYILYNYLRGKLPLPSSSQALIRKPTADARPPTFGSIKANYNPKTVIHILYIYTAPPPSQPATASQVVIYIFHIYMAPSTSQAMTLKPSCHYIYIATPLSQVVASYSTFQPLPPPPSQAVSYIHTLQLHRSPSEVSSHPRAKPCLTYSSVML